MEKISKVNNFSNYEVYSDGRIYSNFTDKFLKPIIDRYGYAYVFVTQDCGKQKKVRVHRLVALAFIPNPNNLPQVNHKDGNKLNNSIENLEWCSAKYNTQHAWDIGLKEFTEAQRNHITNLGKNSAKKVQYINLKTLHKEIFSSLREACENLTLNYDCVRSMISRGKPYLSIHSFAYF